MQLTCYLDDKSHNVRRRFNRLEMRQHRELMLQRQIDANRRKYPALYRIIDSVRFKNWYIICTGKPWDQRLEANPEEMAIKLNAMQLVYGPIPEGN